ncbi:MAG: glycosyltransferase family 87 protein, partial [Pseudomonadota bacterium]
MVIAQPIETSFTARMAPWSLIAAALVLLATYPLARGEGVERVLAYDARYLHAAGHCLWQGLSPYDLTAFRGCWEEATGEGLHSSFVLPPVSFILALPMGLMPWLAAEALFDFVQIAACAALAMVLASLAGMGKATEPRARLTAALWVALALIGHGVVVTVIVGQYAIFTALGIALAVLGQRSGRGWMLALGTLLALWKPHLSLMVLTLLWLGPPLAFWRWKLAVLAVLAALAAAVLAIDPDPAVHFAASMQEHLQNRHTRLSEPGGLNGVLALPGLVSQVSGLTLSLLIAGLVAWLALAWRVQRNCASGIDRAWPVIGCAIVFGAFLVPHKTYDLAIYSVALV